MRKIILGLTSCLALAGCVTTYEQPRPRPYVMQPPPPPQPVMPQALNRPNCREFQQTIVVNGQQQPAYGRACEQPDGSWKIVE
jgi:hypothetical protein